MESARLGSKIGILGGGQLARMLVEAGRRLGIQPIPFAHSTRDPAAQGCLEPIYGHWDDPVALGRFFASVEAVVFENEFVPRQAIDAGLEQAPLHLRPRLLPRFEVIERLQNKIRQKELLRELEIPTAAYQVFETKEKSRQLARGALAEWLRQRVREWDGEVVLKWAELGYDGKGTWIAPRRWDGVAEQQALDFALDAIRHGRVLFAERKVLYKRELSQVACLSVTGEFAAWPLVQSVQEQGICREVRGPAVALGTSEKLEAEARSFAERIARSLGLVGVFAVELFETLDNTLSVNELAPRVHNTGHVTQEGARTSQFENHWRAVLGLPLGDCSAAAPYFGMLNWLGTVSAPAEGHGLPEVPREAHLHWYGKGEIRPGRKLAHLNVTAATPGGLDEALRRARECEKRWWEGVRSSSGRK